MKRAWSTFYGAIFVLAVIGCLVQLGLYLTGAG